MEILKCLRTSRNKTNLTSYLWRSWKQFNWRTTNSKYWSSKIYIYGTTESVLWQLIDIWNFAPNNAIHKNDHSGNKLMTAWLPESSKISRIISIDKYTLMNAFVAIIVKNNRCRTLVPVCCVYVHKLWSLQLFYSIRFSNVLNMLNTLIVLLKIVSVNNA
jgi:hypothetical protein